MNIKLPGLRILFSLLFILIQCDSFSQNTYVKRVGSVHSDVGMSCQPTYDKGVILAVETSTNGMDVHCGLVKTDSNGFVLWNKLFQVGQWCVPQTVLQAKDEGYIVYGMATDSSFLNNNKQFLFLHKTSSIGNTLWDEKISLSINDLAVNLVHRKAGGYLACSVGDYNIGTYPRAVLTRIDDNGNIVWSKQYTAPFGLQPQKMVELNNGNICFVSFSASFSPSPFNDILITLVDNNGNFIWTKNFNTYYDDEPNAVAVNSSDDIFVTGRSIFTNRNWDGFIIKVDSLGNKLLSKFYDAGTSEGEIMRCIVANNDGSFAMLGDMGTFNERDITLLKLDPNASIISEKQYPFSPLFTNYPYEMFSPHDGGFIFTGDFRPPSALRDAILVKTDIDGDIPCSNMNANFTTYTDTFAVSSVILGTINSNISTRFDSSSVPINPFNLYTICSATTDIHTVESKNDFVHVYPNPSSDKITLEVNAGQRIKNLVIYNISGNKISESNLSSFSGNLTLDIKDFSAGVYILECASDNSLQRIKIVKY